MVLSEEGADAGLGAPDEELLAAISAGERHPRRSTSQS
jgi:hypothetical protein